jgi:type III pantothenate kinase
MMKHILCLDIGNTHTHYGVLAEGKTLTSGRLATADVSAPAQGISALITRLRKTEVLDGISFCSVVPDVTARVISAIDASGLPNWQVRHDACPGLDINYPRPEEIGQDRLANAIGAQSLHLVPAIIIDIGTAVTLDVLTGKGYEGGVIAPGLALYTSYLNEKTALLPKVDPSDLQVPSGIGKSTLDAIRIGATVGFTGMIDALLTNVLTNLDVWGIKKTPAILATGGSSVALPKVWEHRIQREPFLTLRGLETAFLRSPAGQNKIPERGDFSVYRIRS